MSYDFDIKKCNLCPRKCGANREIGVGFCGGGKEIKIAHAALHFWEEPCISGKRGSGAVFFSGCSLKCVFCQNFEISSQNQGKEFSIPELSDIFLDLQNKGAHNINLVNPTHYSRHIKESLEMVKNKLHIPVIYNCGGYENTETIKMLSGLIDVYLPDIKYFSSELSKKYSGAGDYFSVSSKAVAEMISSVGYPEYSADGMIKSGVIIRHLVLPSHREDSYKIIDFLSDNFDTEKLTVSLMRQYFPTHKSREYPEINRKLTSLEYDSVTEYALSKNIKNGFLQDKESAKDFFVPKFCYIE